MSTKSVTYATALAREQFISIKTFKRNGTSVGASSGGWKKLIGRPAYVAEADTFTE